MEKVANSQTVPYGKILFTYADRSDKIFMGIGYALAIITGLGLPSFVFLFGNVIDSFGGNAFDAIKKICVQFTVIGACIWVTSYLNFTFLVIMSERVGKKTRVAYLKAIL